jgi:anthranilate phosphoribosyltransferase
MKYAAPVRKALGIRTVFNILGPLTNPSDADTQLVGVYDPRLTEIVARVLLRLGRKRALVVHGDDGLDEISVSTTTQVYALKDGSIEHRTVHPADCGLATHSLASIQGGTAADNAAIITAVLQGKPGAYRDCVLMNAGAAIMAAGASRDMREGIRNAATSIDSGAALQKLNLLRNLTQQLSRQ